LSRIRRPIGHAFRFVYNLLTGRYLPMSSFAKSLTRMKEEQQ
jgi:hypothetical protein